MKVVIVAIFIAVCLAVGVHSASVSYSISNETLTVDGTADVHLNIPIEGVWDSLTTGKKDRILFIAKTFEQLEIYSFIAENNFSFKTD